MREIDPQWIDAASCSDVGRVRSVNQDRFGEFEDGRGSRLLVVADGMGGHRGGETASRLAVEAIGDVFGRSREPPQETLVTALETANERVYESALADPNLAGMGTTVVALCLGDGGEAWVAHVGDSRLYLLRDGALKALTADHSVVAEMQRGGFLSAEEAQVHPRRHELTRSVGVAASVEMDLTRLTVRPGDRFLLCSDGLCGYLDDEEIREILERERPPNAARLLVDRANAKGGHDNVTVQVVAIPDSARVVGEEAEAAATAPPAEAWPEMDRPLQWRRRRRIRRLALAASAVAVVLIAACALWLLLQG